MLREIEKAPSSKRTALERAIADFEVLEYTDEAEHLAAAYLSAKILPSASIEDARHIAVATCHNLDDLVSWNFKHLVNFRRIRLVHLLHDQLGYKRIDIISPQEVIEL